MDLNIPPSDATVRVRAIDCLSDQVVDATAFVSPVPAGLTTLNLPTLAFLVDHARLGRRVLFDCGARKDHQMYAMGVRRKMDEILWAGRTDGDMDELLAAAGIAPASVDSMIWSHWHFDHHGAPEKFPPEVEIVVGPGFKALFMPGFPTKADAILADVYFQGRTVREVAFDGGLVIGGFPAVDYFGDGSFYLLDSPGHAVGHMCALARTTPTTFVFLGGDICHSPGVYRPNAGAPFPVPFLPADQLDAGCFPVPCPCSHFADLHRVPGDAARRTPFFDLSTSANTVSQDLAAGRASVAKMLRFEASADVLVAIAHDLALRHTLPLLNAAPDADINDWQARGYKAAARWFWLNELPRAGLPGRAPFVEGKWWRGQRIASWAEPVGEEAAGPIGGQPTDV